MFVAGCLLSRFLSMKYGYPQQMENPSVDDVEYDGLQGRVYASPGAGPAEARDRAAAFVLLHGIGASHRYLARLHRELAATAPTYSIDLPGFGGTARPDAPLTVAAYAAFVSKVLESLSVRSCVLIGHSMGAQFAVELAVISPALASHLVLIGPVVDPQHPTVREQALALGLDSLREPPSANAIIFTDYVRCGWRWYMTELPVMMGYPIHERIGLVAAPVLVLRGSRDPVAPLPWCQLLQRQAPKGRLVQIPGQAHIAQHSKPAAVAREILSFVEDPAIARKKDQ